MTGKILSPAFLKKEKTQLRVKECSLGESDSPILGAGIDVMTLPEGHLSCVKCHGYKFEAWVYLDNHRLEMGCRECNHSYRLLFPLNIDLTPFQKTGRYGCWKHPDSAVILIHNTDVLCIGCEKCWREVRIDLRKDGGLLIPDA